MRKKLAALLAAILAVGFLAAAPASATITGTTEVQSTTGSARFWHRCETYYHNDLEWNVCANLWYYVDWDRDIAWDHSMVDISGNVRFICLNPNNGDQIVCDEHARAHLYVGGHGADGSGTEVWGCGSLGVHSCVDTLGGDVVLDVYNGEDQNGSIVWDEADAGHQCVNVHMQATDLQWGKYGNIWSEDLWGSGDQQLCTST